MWTHLTFGTLLTHNRDGTPKMTPKFWAPERARLSIPPMAQSHARPCVRFESEGHTYPLTLLFFPDRIGGVYGRDRRTLVALGSTPSDPQKWAKNTHA